MLRHALTPLRFAADARFAAATRLIATMLRHIDAIDVYFSRAKRRCFFFFFFLERRRRIRFGAMPPRFTVTRH